ncbi:MULTISPECIES: hypothetical protein [unclassified Acidovorax]|nr:MULTISPECIES: hypothetical protein [unclassified Acidovorax]
MNFMNTVHARTCWAATCLAACSFANAATVAASTEQAATAIPEAAVSRPSLAEISSPAVLRAYLSTKDEVHNSRYARQINRFCFLKQAPRASVYGDTGGILMIWHNGGEILDSGGRAVRGEAAASLGRAEALAKSVHLATDVVESEAQIAGSTFLVDRAWVHRTLSTCQKAGRTVVVAPLRKGTGTH